jgi:glycosyltransferase involved in cell wall biosynthesis
MTLRVLLTADAVGGIWTYAVDLARGLKALGVEPTVAVIGPPPSPEAAAPLALAGVEHVPLEAALDWTAGDACEVADAAKKVAELAAARRAHLVHLDHPALAGAADLGLPVIAVAHSCVATWWAAIKDGPLPPDLAWRAELTGRGYRAAQGVVAPSAAFAAATRAAYRLAVAPTLVPNGRASPSRAGRLPARPFLLTAGRLWDEGKRLDVLDRAAGRLGVPVIAAGPLEGPNGAIVALPNCVTPGPLGGDALDRLCRSCAAFVSPAGYEPFGLAVLEAAQRGAPLILADQPTFRELWDGAAWFVPPGDDAAVAEAARAVIASPPLAAKLSRAARARARRYGVEAMVGGTLRAYRALLRPAGLASVGAHA